MPPDPPPSARTTPRVVAQPSTPPAAGPRRRPRLPPATLWTGRLILALCLTPLAVLAAQGLRGDLGANPIEAITRALGWWGLVLLLVTLAATPLRRMTGSVLLARRRRLLGLAAFGYLCLHLLSYAGLDQGFHLPTLWADLQKRQYIALGMAGFVLLAALAVTSPRAMVRRLGGRRWQALHRLIYPAAILGVAHFWMMTKARETEPLVFAVLLAVLLGMRLPGPGRRRPGG